MDPYPPPQTQDEIEHVSDDELKELARKLTLKHGATVAETVAAILKAQKPLGDVGPMQLATDQNWRVFVATKERKLYEYTLGEVLQEFNDNELVHPTSIL